MSTDRATALAIEAIEAEAWRDFSAAATPEVRAELGITPVDVAGAFVLTAHGIDSLLFNRVIGLGLAAPAADEDLAAIEAHFAAAPTHFAINLAPIAGPPGLEARLAARGYATFFHHVKWVRDAAPLAVPASPLRIERVPRERAAILGATLADIVAKGAPARAAWMGSAVGRPGWTHYLTWDGEEPAGCAALFVRDENAWLGWGATRPGHRGKGSQSLLLAARIADARAAGATLLTCETGPVMEGVDSTSWRNARRAGFTIAYERPSWIRP